MKHKFIILLLGSVLISIIGCSDDQTMNPNVIFILADDLGIHQLGTYGSTFYETPNIDRIASEGIKFNNAYAAATVCSPTRASIMTGKYPARLNLTDYIPGKDSPDTKLRIPDWKKYLSEEEITMAEIFKSAGYRTGHFGKWHLNKDKKYEKGRPGDPGSQGFDVVLTTHKPGAGPDSKFKNDQHHVKEITSSAIEFIRQNKNQPFFAYVSHNSIHAPEIESEELIEKYEKKDGAKRGGLLNPVQAAMLETLDKNVGLILKELNDLRLNEKTIVVFFSDNGQLAVKDGYPYRGSKGDLYEGGIRMPLIIRWTNEISPGSVNNELIISNDFFATFVDLLNLKDQFSIEDGVSLMPILRNPNFELNRNTLYWHYPHYHGNGLGPQGAIRDGKFKLIEWYEKSYFNEQVMFELYDLENDPSERINLADSLPALVHDLSNKFDQWKIEVGAQPMKINK